MCVNRKIILAAAVMFAGFFSSSAVLHAPQTAYGEMFAGAAVSADFPYFSGVGAELEVGAYRSSFYFGGTAAALDRTVTESYSGEKLHHTRWTLNPVFMWRLFSNKAHTLGFYVGGDVFFGTETLDTWKTLSDETWQSLTAGTTESNSFSESSLVYGTGVRAEIEFFPVPCLAVVARIRPNACFGGQFRWFKSDVTLGLRYNFFL